ncbi:Crp/Fnr family transcriptional regulator [Pelagibacterium montanilacus]|uniref:Crp/Fnr family transcriptional regulator n=1 Tax=Pelagibacterium montanilacus TaxID=2185280 RepID=UPI000F8E0097|nr:Crp/Fnr family transcriptional regulator [Pelagibacterium montanilacus]
MPSSGSHEPGNNLLAALRPSDRAIIDPLLQDWQAEAGTILYEKGDSVRYAYFPRGHSLVSHLVVLEEGRTAETAMIGREGALGGIVSQGHVPAFARADVRLGGMFYRIALTDLEEAKASSLTLRHLFARYADCLMAQIFQSVACSAMHSIEQRTAKWLIAATGRSGEQSLPITQEELAAMLGVGRSYISRTLGGLKARNIITLARGRLTVIDPKALHGLECECNATVCGHFEEVLAGVYPEANGHGKAWGKSAAV